METKYTPMILELSAKIRKIKDEAMLRMTEEQNRALDEMVRGFKLIGWDKYWREADLHADGQIERLMASVLDSELKLNEYDKKTKTGIVDGKAKYFVSGCGCSCPDFIFNERPCKHMYFLASILVELAENQELTIEDFLKK